MRILVFCGARGIPLHGPSGASAHLRGVARALARAGHEVRIATPLSRDHRGATDLELDLPAVHSPPRPRRWMGPFRERGETWDARRLLDRAVADWEPDWIWERYALFCDAGRRSGLPRIVEVNAPLSLERQGIRDRRYAQRTERATLQSAHRVVAVSAWLARWAVQSIGCAPHQVHRVPNGVAPSPPGQRQATRARLGLDGLVVGFVGSMKPWHGVARLPALLDALPEATALVVGDGPVPVPPHPRIRAVGRVEGSRLPDLVAAMDVGLAPYPTDAPPWFCPLKILDYRAQGVPVVATDRGDCRALVGTDGEILGTDAPLVWADAIRRQARAPRRVHRRTWDAVVAEALVDLP